MKKQYRYAGLNGLATEALHQACNAVVYFDMLNAMAVEKGAVAECDCPPPFEARFLRDEEILAARERRIGEFADPFVLEALNNDDRCFAVLDGGNIASYAWYSRQPTHVTEDFHARFNPEWAYMHHAFTAPAYRGKRLYAVGMAGALAALDCRGLFCIVAANNFGSLKSTRRFGYRIFGRYYFVGRLGRYVVYQDNPRGYDFTLAPDAGVRALLLPMN